MSYKYHYVDRLRPKYMSSALIFGSALDSAINNLLKQDGKDPRNTFDYHWRWAEIAGQRTYIPESEKVVYSNSDFDKDLLLQEDFNELYKKTNLSSESDVLELYKKLSETKKTLSWDRMSDSDKKVYNFYNWSVLRRKGHLMIDAYKKDILPNITKIHAVQKHISMENDDGDKISGFIDLIADWKDEGTIIFDLKTSTIHYDEDSVLTSPQLTLYTSAIGKEYNTRKAGYLVLKKQIDKNRQKVCSVCGYDGSGARHKTCSNEAGGSRCGGEWIETIRPSVNYQVIIDAIPDRTEEIVMENFNQINQGIKNEQFHRNFSSCVRPWGKCEFFNKCYRNDDSDLIKQEDKKKKKD